MSALDRGVHAEFRGSNGSVPIGGFYDHRLCAHGEGGGFGVRIRKINITADHIPFVEHLPRLRVRGDGNGGAVGCPVGGGSSAEYGDGLLGGGGDDLQIFGKGIAAGAADQRAAAGCSRIPIVVTADAGGKGRVVLLALCKQKAVYRRRKLADGAFCHLYAGIERGRDDGQVGRFGMKRAVTGDGKLGNKTAAVMGGQGRAFIQNQPGVAGCSNRKSAAGGDGAAFDGEGGIVLRVDGCTVAAVEHLYIGQRQTGFITGIENTLIGSGRCIIIVELDGSVHNGYAGISVKIKQGALGRPDGPLVCYLERMAVQVKGLATVSVSGEQKLVGLQGGVAAFGDTVGNVVIQHDRGISAG